MPEMNNIALIGNMNNNFNALTKYLRSLGYNANLYLYDDNHPHFHPSNDLYDDSWKEYTKFLDWGSLESFKSFDKDKILKDLLGVDKIICCGTGAAFLSRAGIPIDIFIPYGSDLYSVPFFKLTKFKNQFASLLHSKFQKRAIKDAKNIIMASTGGILEKFLNKINPKGYITNCGIPMVFYPQYYNETADNYAEECAVFQKLLKEKENNYKIIFHSSRHCWKNVPDEASRKSNHLLFIGMAQLLKEKPETKIKIATFEYGPDVSESKKLIKELGIKDNVIWFPQSPRKDLMLGLSISDLATGEFYHSYFSYGVVYESMALSIPLMHKREDVLYENEYETLYPMIHASTEKEIYNTLKDLNSEPEKISKIGLNSHQWFLENMITKPIDEILSLLQR